MRKIIIIMMVMFFFLILPYNNVQATEITFSLVKWDTVATGTNSGTVDNIIIGDIHNGDINEVVLEGWESLPNCYEVHDDDQNSYVQFNLSNYVYINNITIHLKHYTGTQGVAVNKGHIYFYEDDVKVMALRYSWEDDGWFYLNTVDTWVQIDVKQNAGSWRTDVLTITHNGSNNMIYDIDGVSLDGTTMVDGEDWFSFDTIRFCANSTNAFTGGYQYGFTWRIDDFNLTVSDSIGFNCECPADLINFDCPDENVVVNNTVGFLYYIFGDECSGATFRLKNSTYQTIETTTRGEGLGVVRWNVDYGHGLGTWYIIAYDCYTGTERLNCSINVVSDSGIGNYDLICQQDIYNVGDYISFLVLAPDGEIVTIRDDHIDFSYTTTFEGTGFYESLNNVFPLTRPRQNLCFELVNETDVVVSYDCVNVIEEYGYYSIKWKSYLDADDSGDLTSGDTISIFGSNGFTDTNDNVFLIAYSNASGTPSIKHSWQMNAYGNDYEFLYRLTGNTAQNENDLYLRMALKDWVSDEYTYIDDYYVTVSYTNFEPPDTHTLLPDVGQPLGFIFGMITTVVCTCMPFFFALEVKQKTHLELPIPTFVYAVTGGTGIAFSTFMGWFPSWVIFWLIAVGIIAVMFGFVYGLKAKGVI